MSLRDVQTRIIRAVTGDLPASSAAGVLRETGAASVDERLAAYQSIIEANHLQALDQVYRVTREVLGGSYWHQLLRDSLGRIGSSDSDLNRFGRQIPALLKSQTDRRSELKGLEYLSDLAGLEWRLHEAGMAPDDEPFDWTEFSAVPAAQHETVRLMLSHSLSILVTPFPVDVIWCLHSDRDPPDEMLGPYTLCVFRERRFHPAVARLDDDEASILRLLQERVPLGELERRIAATARPELVATLMSWVRRGWITSYRTDRPHVR